jgi:hypothetical protein
VFRELLSGFHPLWYFGKSSKELVAQSVEQRTFNAWVVGSIPTELTTSMAANPRLFNPSEVTSVHDRCTEAWHHEVPEAAPSISGLECALKEQHLANFQLWHAEDAARTPGATDQELARIKRFIDSANQRRNDLTEQCDLLLLELLHREGLPAAGGELHSESPGLMLDRLSILSLKIFHTREEIDRPGAPTGHRERNLERLGILLEQRDDLAASLDRLWQQILEGQRRFKLYRQLKMYNDPALNPAVYGKS